MGGRGSKKCGAQAKSDYSRHHGACRGLALLVTPTQTGHSVCGRIADRPSPQVAESTSHKACLESPRTGSHNPYGQPNSSSPLSSAG